MLVITGLMRSGTSACAELCHSLGYVMGRSMPMPRMGTNHVEWEDADISEDLANLLLLVSDATLSWNAYIVNRRDHCEQMRQFHVDGIVRGWGIKSPMLAPFYDDFNKSALVVGEPVTLIAMRREFHETISSIFDIGKSIRDEANVKRLIDIQTVIGSHMESIYEKADIVINCEYLRSHPERVAASINDAVRG